MVMKVTSEAKMLSDAGTWSELLGGPLILAHDGSAARITAWPLADVSLTSGEVVACDAAILDELPFERRVTPGRYPLTLLIAKIKDDERVAFAVLRFSAQPVLQWELAIKPGQDRTTLKPDQIFGYGVDSGTGAFADAKAIAAIVDDPEAMQKFVNDCGDEMQKCYRHTRSWAVAEGESGSIAAFSSGYGDGFYASYFGLDAAGAPAVLVTDFGICDWPRRPTSGEGPANEKSPTHGNLGTWIRNLWKRS
jgi:hypothetical protein